MKNKIEKAKLLGLKFLKEAKNTFDSWSLLISNQTPEFNNSQNRSYEDDTGKILWHSRATATCIILLNKDKNKVLLTQRGKTVSHTGKWSLPCGYIDWSENIYEAASRELYEECGIYIKPKVFEKRGFYEVNSNPNKDELQNITFHFHITLDVNEENVKIKIDNKEVSCYKWATLSDIEKLEFAFGHKNRARRFLK